MLPDAATTRKGIGWVWGRVVEIVHPVATVRIARTSFDQCPIVPLTKEIYPPLKVPIRWISSSSYPKPYLNRLSALQSPSALNGR
jgi:hypothetical protein